MLYRSVQVFVIASILFPAWITIRMVVLNFAMTEVWLANTASVVITVVAAYLVSQRPFLEQDLQSYLIATSITFLAWIALVCISSLMSKEVSWLYHLGFVWGVLTLSFWRTKIKFAKDPEWFIRLQEKADKKMGNSK